MRRASRIAAWMVLAAGTTMLGTGASGETPVQSAGLEVEQGTIDLGRVVSGRDAVATFVIRNHGDHPIKILSAKPS